MVNTNKIKTILPNKLYLSACCHSKETYSLCKIKLCLLTGSSQAVTSQEHEQLSLDCAATTLPDDNARRHDSTIQAKSSSKPQSKQQKTKRVRPKKTTKQKASQKKIANSEVTDVTKEFAETFVSGLIKIESSRPQLSLCNPAQTHTQFNPISIPVAFH